MADRPWGAGAGAPRVAVVPARRVGIAAMSTKASQSICPTAGSLALPTFAFYEQQMTALAGLVLNLVRLSSLEFGIARESALAGLNDFAAAKPAASDDAARGL